MLTNKSLHERQRQHLRPSIDHKLTAGAVHNKLLGALNVVTKAAVVFSRGFGLPGAIAGGIIQLFSGLFGECGSAAFLVNQS